MTFVYRKWDMFCKNLKNLGLISIPAYEVDGNCSKYLVLKHDIETDVSKAFAISQIEYKYGHRGSYYVQAYLMENPKNIDLLKKMQSMGHEISYHHDVMDSNEGDLDKANDEFMKNKEVFVKNGMQITTVCQHGNPIVERIGYTSNRDFFRSEMVQSLYPEIADIMVDFKQKHSTEYTYYSDAGRSFKMIFDPINNDLINSDDKNIVYSNMDDLLDAIQKNNCNIISIHPHRWTSSVISYSVKKILFNVLKLLAKILLKVPVCKKIMSKYYYLAKKI